MKLADGREHAKDDQSNPPEKSTALPAGLSGLRRAATYYFPALALRHWRHGTNRIRVGRPASGSRPESVAGPPVWSDRIRWLSLLSSLVICRQWIADQSRALARG